jgi:hypothetical protein
MLTFFPILSDNYHTTLRRLNMLFSLCSGVYVAMVEGNHRMFYCCMKLFGRELEVEGKDTKIPFKNAYERLRTDCAYYQSIGGCDVIIHKPENGIPHEALSAISNWYQLRNNTQLEGNFLSQLNKFLTENSIYLLSEDDAMAYVTNKTTRENRDATTVDLLKRLCEAMLRFASPLNTRHLQVTAEWDVTFKEIYSRVVLRDKKTTNSSDATPSKKPKKTKDTETGSHQTQLNFCMPDSLIAVEMTNAKGRPGNISFDGRHLWNINHSIRTIIGSTTAKQTVKETSKLFYDQNPLLMVGLTDLVTILNCFPSLRQKMRTLQSELKGNSYANNLEFFVVNILMPAQQLACLSEYAFVLAYCAREFIKPRKTYAGGRIVKADEDENHVTRDGLLQGLNDDGRVYVRETESRKVQEKVSEGPLQDFIRYVYKAPTYRPARREFAAMTLNIWLTVYMDAMIAEQNKQLGEVNKDLEDMTQKVYNGTSSKLVVNFANIMKYEKLIFVFS